MSCDKTALLMLFICVMTGVSEPSRMSDIVAQNGYRSVVNFLFFSVIFACHVLLLMILMTRTVTILFYGFHYIIICHVSAGLMKNELLTILL